MIVKSIDVPRTSSFKRDKRPSWYSTRVRKASGGRNFPNPPEIGYGRGIRLWIFLVPKRDFRTDEGREFVETRRRHEAIVHWELEIFLWRAYFWFLIARVFKKLL